MTLGQEYPRHTGLLSTMGKFVQSNIQTIILCLAIILALDVAFNIAYIFLSDQKQKQPAEEQKKHKCKDPHCQHAVYQEDMRVDEDENLVFDEQADVVFTQPNFNIKD